MVSMSHCSSSLIKKYRSSNKTDSAPSSQLNGSSGEIINGSRDHLLGNKEAVSFIPMIFNNNPDTCKGSNNCQSSKTLYGSTRVQGANSSNQEIADTYVQTIRDLTICIDQIYTLHRLLISFHGLGLVGLQWYRYKRFLTAI